MRKKTLAGTSLVGGSVNYERIENDFYATDPQSVRDLLDIADIQGNSFYEPCCGQGHISRVLREYYPTSEHSASDLIDRGYGEILDFLKWEEVLNNEFIPNKVDWIITNPPYKYAKEFIDRSLAMTNKGVAMFLKIQFLEGQARKEWFQENPPKYVYVFSKRQNPWRNGESMNPKTGKKWGSTMCFAWFIWEKDFDGNTIIKWI